MYFSENTADTRPQEELLAHAAVPALVSCLAAGGVDAAVHAAEALVHLAGGEAVCKVRGTGTPGCLRMAQTIVLPVVVLIVLYYGCLLPHCSAWCLRSRLLLPWW